MTLEQTIFVGPTRHVNGEKGYEPETAEGR